MNPFLQLLPFIGPRILKTGALWRTQQSIYIFGQLYIFVIGQFANIPYTLYMNPRIIKGEFGTQILQHVLLTPPTVCE